ncbi:MAG: OB-fold domain-containing protein [Pseudomonadales bacterium]
MALDGEYLGMAVHIDDLDQENLAFYGFCGRHELRVQKCRACGLLRCPPTTACPFCAHADSDWVPVSGKGVVYSYGEVSHAIQGAFRRAAPYLLLLVELDEQRGLPGPHDGLRFQGNLADTRGELADAALVRSVGIGTRVKVVFRDMGEGLAMPLWMVDPDSPQPERPWRYPD